MKFIYDGEYKEFRGYVFKWSKPTEVTDKATQEILLKDPLFWRCDEEAKETAEEKPVLDRYACPKCGKHVKQGHYMHVKHCRGPK
jgi:Zn finger protein HypA/HybF involved in hydrogenase expression